MTDLGVPRSRVPRAGLPFLLLSAGASAGVLAASGRLASAAVDERRRTADGLFAYRHGAAMGRAVRHRAELGEETQRRTEAADSVREIAHGENGRGFFAPRADVVLLGFGMMVTGAARHREAPWQSEGSV